MTTSVAIKPHKGRISDWFEMECSRGLGFFVVGHFIDHPDFAGLHGHTSWVEAKHPSDDGTIEIETRNSRYTLINGDNT